MGCTTIRRKTLRCIRQYKDNWATTTVCRMRHLVYSFFTYDIWSKKNVNARLQLTLPYDVIFGGVLESKGIITVGTTKQCYIGLQESIVE